MTSVYRALYIIPNLYHYNIPFWCIENIISIIDESSPDITLHGAIFDYFIEHPLYDYTKNNFKIARDWIEKFYNYMDLQEYCNEYLKTVEEYLEMVYMYLEMETDKRDELIRMIINIFNEEARIIRTDDILGLWQKYKEVFISKELYKSHEDITQDIKYSLVKNGISTDPDIDTCSYTNYLFQCDAFMEPCIIKLYPDYNVISVSTLEDINNILNSNGNKHIYYQEILSGTNTVTISQTIINLFNIIQSYTHDIVIYISTRSPSKNDLIIEEKIEKIENHTYIYEFPETVEIKNYDAKKNYVLISIIVTLDDLLKTRYRALFTNYINDIFYMKLVNYTIQYYDLLI